MKPFARSDRVSGQIQKVLSEILLKKIKDPRLEKASITDVKMSRDLRIARIYFVASGNKKSMEEAAEGFKSALGYVKRTLARRLGLRYMPDLKFFYDESFDYGSRIDKVLKAVKADNGPNNTLFEK
ncbi:MAG: 30S ribosome-binding factor RbfA [Deltaproteobacteria bacterium]|nr:30S ribosome-binding factor RbfA [Deltaproteobacteria bacterium]OQY13889.1 MAG: ribosome-binding factor A [Desulfobacteraceae bacterium 4572_187]MBW1957337.1 30S ribosome-binding factor RbfA [Deltaproteobacteria bacterium]MBW2012308.1 30S ribosome-binding factor RbfA [Deltaproteobacteria bacterium]MBW2088912.1 30S ribosome-binding factor RbfA [Deltaproteobacteria bacterium]